ncbi:MAG: hypothetical protein LC749_04255 [Actinobacteria bacterium]|nr:hypothetical protein [Actinomycetota bacterium]
MTSPPQLFCPRDHTPTLLACAQCGTPICPRCSVRTEVGLRCPDCAGAAPGPVAASRPKWLTALVVAVVVALALVAGRVFSGGGTPNVVPDPAASAVDDRVVDRPGLGFRMEIPFSWTNAPDPGTGTVYFAHEGRRAWVRVWKEQDLPLAQLEDRVMTSLRKQGGVQFVRQATQIGGFPTIQLDFLLPVLNTPGDPLAPRRWYLIKGNMTDFTLALGTTNLAEQEPAFERIASSFRPL